MTTLTPDDQLRDPDGGAVVEPNTIVPLPDPHSATTDGTDFMVLIGSDPGDDAVSGVSFDDLVGARDDEIVDLLVLVALAGTTSRNGNRNPMRGAYLLREAARHLLAVPMEHFLIDAPDGEGRRPAS